MKVKNYLTQEGANAVTRSRTFYYPLVVILFFGLALSLMPANPALGSNMPFGVTLQQPNLSPNSLVRYSHTFQVSSGGSSIQNGTALLGARDIIVKLHPSAVNPYLIKLEPGNYDLGNDSLKLLPYLDLEGSGEGITVISSISGQTTDQLTGATLIAASNSEARFLQIANSGANPFQAAVLVPRDATNVRFNHLATRVSGGTDTNIGLYTTGADVTLNDSNLTTTGGKSSYSLFHNDGAITVTNSILTASGASVNDAAIFDNLQDHIDEFPDETVTVNNSSLNATGPTFAAAVWDARVGILVVNNSTLTANVNTGRNNGTFVAGILNNDSGNITANAISMFTCCGFNVHGIYTAGDLTVTNSNITSTGGTTVDILRPNGTSVLVANSVLRGNGTTGLMRCPGSIDGSFGRFLNATCN
jgi:hypothetical protein